jgi:type II secretory pathway component PulJ
MNRVNFRQSGATLMEVLVAMSISLVVTSAMIAMMANSLGTTARIVKMTKLADDMRVAMQMMTRDVRRTSYNARSMFCYGNPNCGADEGGPTMAGDITIAGGGECLTFLLDRDHDGDSTENAGGGFRRVTDSGIGVMEMWTAGAAANCDVDAGWVRITDPEDMDILSFSADEALSYETEIFNDGTTSMSQKVRKIRLSMQGRLVLDNTVVREVEDIITVRNDLLL